MTVVPNCWSYPQLGEIAETALGKMLDRGRRRGLGQVSYLRNVNVQWGRIDADDVLTMEMDDSERDRFGLRAGDLLVCEGGEIGRAAIWNGSDDYMAYQKALHRIRPAGAVEARYLLHLFAHYAANGYLAANATGSTIMHLPQQNLRRLRVPLPSIEEQRRIVDILEDHLSRLDAGRDYLKACAARAASLRSSLVASELSREETEVVQLGDLVAESRTGWDRGRAYLTEVDEGYPYLKMNNITVQGDLDLSAVARVVGSDAAAQRYSVQEGDVLFNNRNSRELVGKTALADSRAAGWTYNNNLVRLRFHPQVLPAFAAIQMNAEPFRTSLRSTISATTNVAAIYTRDLLRQPFHVPDLLVQERTVKRHDEMRDAEMRLLRQLVAAQDRSLALRRSVLQAGFSGLLTGTADDKETLEELTVV